MTTASATASPAFDVDAAMGDNSPTKSPDALEALKNGAREARLIERNIEDLENQLSDAKAKLQRLYQNTLVGLMDAAEVDFIGIPASGNFQAKDFELKPFYSASIAASWPEEKREAAFAMLTKYKAEDLIKTELSIHFPGGGLSAAKKLMAAAKKIKVIQTITKTKKDRKTGKVKITKLKVAKPVVVEISKAVPSGTLKAWLRELVEKRNIMLPSADLEKIGGSVGRIVKPKDRAE